MFLLLVVIGALGLLLVSYVYSMKWHIQQIERHLKKISDDLRELKRGPEPKPWESAKNVTPK